MQCSHMQRWRGPFKALAVPWPFVSSGRPCGGGGGGPEKEKKKKKWWPQRPTCVFFFLWTPPPPQQPRVLFAYSFTLLSPFSSPIRKLLIAHAFPQIHEPPYPPFIIVLIARNLSGRIAASKNLKNHTYAKMGAPQRPFLYLNIFQRPAPKMARGRLFVGYGLPLRKCVFPMYGDPSS